MPKVKKIDCYRTNLCIDCDDESCLNRGHKEGDCPLQMCKNKRQKECNSCHYIDDHIEELKENRKPYSVNANKLMR